MYTSKRDPIPRRPVLPPWIKYQLWNESIILAYKRVCERFRVHSRLGPVFFLFYASNSQRVEALVWFFKLIFSTQSKLSGDLSQEDSNFKKCNTSVSIPTPEYRPLERDMLQRVILAVRISCLSRVWQDSHHLQDTWLWAYDSCVYRRDVLDIEKACLELSSRATILKSSTHFDDPVILRVYQYV